MKRSHYALLIIIFLLALSTRIYFSFGTENYSSDKAYFMLRQIEHIQQTSKPLYDDDLSFSGRRIVFPPLFGYLLAFLGLVFSNDFTAKFFPNLFASLLVFFAYLIARKISKNSAVALLTAFISCFIPVFFQQTFNSISVYSVVVPLFFLLMYSFMNIKKQKWVYCYVITIVMLTLIHPSAILFIVGLWFYLLLTKLEKLKHTKAELEIVIFSSFFVLLSQFIMFKKIFLFHGPLVIWQNIPKELLSNYFAEISILHAIYYIGVIPVLCGVYVIYRYIFKQKSKHVYLLIAFIFSFALLLWMRLIEVNAGLVFLGVIMALLFSEFLGLFLAYAKKTRASRFVSLFWAGLFVLIIITSVVPSLSLAQKTLRTSVTEQEIDALNWLQQNTHEDAVIAATVDEGNLVTEVAQRKNIADSNFLLIRDAKQRVEDLKRIYTTFSLTEAVTLLNKYHAHYIYFSPKAKSAYGISELKYTDDNCFEEVYSRKVKIYKSLCRMEELK